MDEFNESPLLAVHRTAVHSKRQPPPKETNLLIAPQPATAAGQSHAPMDRFSPFQSELSPIALLVAGAALLAPAALSAQATDTAAANAGALETEQQTIRVYLDCPGWLCDFDYFRRQVGYVSWVRDRNVADVQVLVTQQGTGGGGQRITLDLIGRSQFQGIDRRLTYTSAPSETDTETRDGLLRVLKLGLAGFLARTEAAGQLDLTYEGEAAGGGGDQPSTREDDPWNRWVFEVDMGGGFDQEGRSEQFNVEGSLSANRTTRELKVDIGVNGEYSESEFQLSDDSTFTSIQRSYGVRTVVVNSVGDHWSVGGQGSMRHSTERNQELAVTGGPAIEYNFFPYSESTRRQLTVLYSVSGNAFDYQQETVFEQLSEQRLSHSLDVSLDAQEPWGEVGVSLRGSHYLDEIEQNRVTLSGRAEFQLIQGLSFNVFGVASRVRDQIYLPLEEASREEILVGEREFATDFEYHTRVGFSYTFGSIYSSVVNARFDNLGESD